MSLKIAFVGIKRPFLSIQDEIGISIETFIKFHLEIPWYYYFHGANDCYVSTVDTGYSGKRSDPADDERTTHGSDGGVYTVKEAWVGSTHLDVVVHWRSWQQWAYDASPSSLHLLQTCDHSYSDEWKKNVKGALEGGQLSRIICFDTWHVRNTMRELGVGWQSVLTNVHLGVDTATYRPLEKDPFKLLWASDPGRGLTHCLDMFRYLYQRDRRYRLHIACPDYVKNQISISHPAISVHGHLKNGPELWDMFATSAFLPYTCQFMEPSSRAHRQAQAAGCCVLYPSDRGSPSSLIVDGRTGVIMGPHPEPLNWALKIDSLRESGEYIKIGTEARIFALTEDWNVQAIRFNNVCKELKR